MNPDIQNRIEALPPRQQHYFKSLMKEGDGNPFVGEGVVRELLTGGTLLPEDRHVAQLALVAFGEAAGSHSHRIEFDSDEQAAERIKAQIAEAREYGETAKADQLQAVLDSAAAKTQADAERAEQVRSDWIENMAKDQDEKVEKFQQQFAEQKQIRISELMNKGFMDAEKAEKFFNQQQAGTLERSLRRQLGLESTVHGNGTG